MQIGHALHHDQLELHSVTEMFYSGQSKQKGSFIPEVSFQIYEGEGGRWQLRSDAVYCLMFLTQLDNWLG